MLDIPFNRKNDTLNRPASESYLQSTLVLIVFGYAYDFIFKGDFRIVKLAYIKNILLFTTNDVPLFSALFMERY
jgi:hypothetical protein